MKPTALMEEMKQVQGGTAVEGCRGLTLIETEDNGGCQEPGGREVGSQCLMGTEFQFCKRKSSGGWLHNYVNVLNTSCMLKAHIS